MRMKTKYIFHIIDHVITHPKGKGLPSDLSNWRYGGQMNMSLLWSFKRASSYLTSEGKQF